MPSPTARRAQPRFRGFAFEAPSLEEPAIGRHLDKLRFADPAGRGFPHRVRDMGARIPEIRLVCEVYGTPPSFDDWEVRAETFKGLLNEPGVGTLFLPGQGELRVRAELARRRETVAALGRTEFEVVFVPVEVGGPAPAVQADTAAAQTRAVEELVAATEAEFVRDWTLDLSRGLAVRGARELLSGLGAGVAELGLSELSRLSQPFLAPTEASLVDAAGLAGDTRALLTGLLARPADSAGDAVAVLAGGVPPIAEALTLAESLPLPRVRPASTSSRVQVSALSAAFGRLVGRSAVAAAALASEEIPVGSRAEALSLRRTLLTGIDAEIDRAAEDLAEAGLPRGTSGGDPAAAERMLPALRDLKAAVKGRLDARAGALPSVRRLTLPGARPAVVVAYDLYEEPTRFGELQAAFAVPNPARLPNARAGLVKAR